MQYPAKIRLKRFAFCLNALALWCLSGPLQAEEFLNSWYWHAFASQGAVYTSDNNFYGSSNDNISSDFRELGLLAGWQPLNDFHVVGQLLSRRAGHVDKTDLRVDYAFASYSFYSDLDQELGVRLGRLRSPMGFYNQTRDVAHTRPGIMLPQSVYVERLRSLFFARDGVQLFGSYRYGLSELSWDVVYGKILLDEELYLEVLEVEDLPGEVDIPLSPVARVLWDWDMGRVRLGVTYSGYKGSYKAEEGSIYSQLLQDARVSLKHWIFSAEYNAADWSLTSEYMTYKSNLGDLIVPELRELLPSMRFDARGHGYYVQGTYRLNPKWEVFSRWDVQYVDESRRDDPWYYTKDVTVGLGWRPDSNWLLRTEWHVVDGTSSLSPRENRRQDYERRWQMVLFQISYRI